MTCFHPLIRLEETGRYIKAKDGHLYHPFRVISPANGDLDRLIKETKYTKATIIPCGKCIGCRLESSRQKANQGSLEASMLEQDRTWFATITYDDDHIYVPELIEDEHGITWIDIDAEEEWGGSLVGKDLQDFVKRLRYHVKQKYPLDYVGNPVNNELRFMMCGEYGGQTERPHYHLIIFGLYLPIEDLYAPRMKNGDVYYQSKILETAWDKGISNITPASWNTIAYVGRYVTKKISGDKAIEYYARKGQAEKEFYRCSNRPGIGKSYYDKNWIQIYNEDKVLIKTKKSSEYVQPPKYFDKLLEKEHPYLWDLVKRDRRIRAEKRAGLKTERTSLTILEQLEVDERLQQLRANMLKRGLEVDL